MTDTIFGMDQDIRKTLDIILETQMGYLKQQLDMDAQLHALQIVLLSIVPESIRLHTAQVLQETFDEQRKARQEAFVKQSELLSLLRATVSTKVVQ